MSWARALLVAFTACGVVVANAPAGWLALVLPSPLKFSYSSGTLWAGSAVLATSQPLCAIDWRLGGVERQSLVIELQGRAPCEGHARLLLGANRLDLTDLVLTVSADRLSREIPAAHAWAPGGELKIEAAALAVAPRTQGQGQLTWSNARAAGLPVSPLGDYRADFTLDGANITAAVTTINGPLMLEGSVSFAGQLQANVLASSDEAQVAGWIRTLGIAESSGRYRLRMP